ncbi:uncharacterized protein LOC122479392 [Prionailurus bengalensis]|uniref:uncharacterized protein LOC122479392 n=1 Tax=Prionailurus bengalensis TaxID=37029 RepID=UPI001CAA3112|nr:uncharacterized protein LOC122479392 [Prionailurus bengalensis]
MGARRKAQLVLPGWPLPLGCNLNQNGTVRALAARQESVPGAREPGRGEAAREKEGVERKDKVRGDWLSRVAGARSLRLLSALLQRRSGRRLRAPSRPIRIQPALAEWYSFTCFCNFLPLLYIPNYVMGIKECACGDVDEEIETQSSEGTCSKPLRYLVAEPVLEPQVPTARTMEKSGPLSYPNTGPVVGVSPEFPQKSANKNQTILYP